uniref:Protein phosphatase 1 regulatory subunit 15B n=1 Tax=Leptobrachium leishanense TaxID=445787 RepID=A0A8C5LZC4_9ANUR
MCADRDTSSSPGLRGLLGRILHGLLPYRLLQLLGAALSYLMGPWGEAVLAFITPEWIVPRQVEAAGLPDVLEEVLKGLKPVPWGVSCILSPGPNGVLTMMSAGMDGKGQDGFSQGCGAAEDSAEILYQQENALWFLQQNKSWQDLNPKWQQELLGDLQEHLDLTHKLHQPVGHLAIFEWGQNLQKPGGKLMDLFESVREEQPKPQQLVVPETRTTEKPGGNQKLLQLSIPLNIPGAPACSEGPSDPSPDQGYNSLEDWQFYPRDTANSGDPKEPVPDSPQRAGDVPTDQLDLITVAMQAGPSSGEDSDPNANIDEEIPVPEPPVCTNKYIGYILGTLVSDEDDLSSCSDGEDSEAVDEEDDDDGFDSEGSVSETDSGAQGTEGVELWNSFYTPDPYNPQNFTAMQHTGACVEQTSHMDQVHEDVLSDEESWCESDTLSTSDSEEECSIDEEESLKLWNSFSKCDDPYNPLWFKASVHTSKGKRLPHRDVTSKNTELICGNPQNHKLSTPCLNEYRQLSWCHNTPLPAVEKSNAIIAKKKVTFQDEVTVYNVCSEEERKGPWEEFARDRCRFQRRIQETQAAIGHCLTTDHRQMIWDCMIERWGS